uniref:Lipoprotein n=1 Tax=Fundidesulfovibrio putealis TaxID=270496 RepID=A0A7C4EIP6_9BACT
MRRLTSLLLALLALGYVASCSTVPAQSVALRPDVKAPAGNVGKGKPVALRVVDARSGQVLGYRATDGSKGAPITVQGDLSQAVGEPVSKALSDLGFAPAAYKDGAPLTVTVTIRELTYQAEAKTVSRNVITKCTLAVRATNGPGTWEGSFPVRQERELMLAPDEDANARLINDVLTESLSMMMSDPELVQFLGKDTAQGKTIKQ